MSPSAAVYLAVFGATCDAIALAAIFWWIASRKRIAGEIVGRAEQHAVQTRQQVAREAESLKKEAQLEAREQAHGVIADAEAKARARQQEMAGLEHGLADKTRALTDRLAATDALERDLRARDAVAADVQMRLDAATIRSDQLVADRQRELQRVAGLTAEEARELLLKQIETDARRDAANLVKRLEAEARETAAARAQQIITDAIQRSAAETAIETT